MANIIYRRGMAMLDDANVSKDINDAISLCRHGDCVHYGDCAIRSQLLNRCESDGIFAPITGCRSYTPHNKNELTFQFDE